MRDSNFGAEVFPYINQQHIPKNNNDETRQGSEVFSYQIGNISTLFNNGLLTPAYSPNYNSFDIKTEQQLGYLNPYLIPLCHTENVFHSTPKKDDELSVTLSNNTSEDNWENPTLSFVDSQSSFSVSQDSSSYYLDTAEILLRSINSPSSSSVSYPFTPLTSCDDLLTQDNMLSSVSPSISEPIIGLKSKKQVKRKRRTKKERANLRYNVNDTPISEQLLNNKLVWEKVLQTKKKGIYKCAHCVKVFPDLYQFALHLDQEKVVRPHKCPFNDCPWSILGLPRKAEIRRHCAAQHELNIEENGETHVTCPSDSFKCQYEDCDRVFKRKDSYARHDKLVHQNPSSRFNKRIHKAKEVLRKKELAGSLSN